MINIPEVKVGIVAVSRDCFPESLSVNRRKALIKAYTDKYDAKDIYECPVCIVESENHMEQALADIKAAGCNALCVYLGNFGPEISETMLAKYFDGPKMFVAAATQCDFDIDVYYNRVVIDAKSILGVLSLDLRNILTVQYDGENEAFEAFLEKMAVKRTAA